MSWVMGVHAPDPRAAGASGYHVRCRPQHPLRPHVRTVTVSTIAYQPSMSSYDRGWLTLPYSAVWKPLMQMPGALWGHGCFRCRGMVDAGHRKPLKQEHQQEQEQERLCKVLQR